MWTVSWTGVWRSHTPYLGTQMHTCDVGGTVRGRHRGQREINKWKALEVRDLVLVSSLCLAPDATC